MDEQLRKNNISAYLKHTFFYTIYQSTCQWNVFDAYLLLLAKSRGVKNVNTWVGFAEGISGLCTLVLAFPLGMLVDTVSRTMLIKVAIFVGSVATVISFYAFVNDNVLTLYINLVLWGVFVGLQGTAGEAVFADSISTGKRSKVFSTKGILNTCGLAAGPTIMTVLFLCLGSAWQIEDLHIPLIVGLSFAPVSFYFLGLMQNPKLYLPSLKSGGVVMLHTPLLDRRTPLCLPSNSSIEELERERFRMMPQSQKFIPYLVTASEFVLDIGAGMTVRFFPLFFIEDYHVQPYTMSIIFSVYPLCVAGMIPIGHKMSKYLGRAQASLVLQVLGILTLFLMASVEGLKSLLFVFILRGMFQNACIPLDRSIAMDFVPSDNRGKWNAITTLTNMTWSGSAILGGFIADSNDYRYTFLITACVYIVGSLIYLPLVRALEFVFLGLDCSKERRHSI